MRKSLNWRVLVVTLGCLCVGAAACSRDPGGSILQPAPVDPGLDPLPEFPPEEPGLDNVYGVLGPRVDNQGGVRFRLFSSNATRVELSLYSGSMGAPALHQVLLEKEGDTPVWAVHLTAAQLEEHGLPLPFFYGYRAWGPNWPHDAAWVPGSNAGFISDVDDKGNRFNPNKLLVDPYARELSHDPTNSFHHDPAVYFSGPQNRDVDTAMLAPKGVVFNVSARSTTGAKPTRALKEDVIYETHVRGLTMGDPSIDPGCAGTYAAAKEKIPYLKELGITAVEFLPVQETWNDNNDESSTTSGKNYWGYSTLAFFAPDRRYSCDKSPGGPTREFRDMVRAFHDAGLKVFIDVVFNHSGEGNPDSSGERALLSSFRGLDNASYYQLREDTRFYRNDNGVSGNLHVTQEVVRGFVIDSVRYWAHEMGVDGFRFDLASILGNGCEGDCFQFEPSHRRGILARLSSQLPGRNEDGGEGVDLIAEPWAISEGTYQIGNYPRGWSEWNDKYRDTLRRSQNERDVNNVSPRTLLLRIAGSADVLKAPRARSASINFVVAHDGFTLGDLYSCSQKRNNQAWPFGPSDGGSDYNLSWDQGGDEALQRQAARNGLALLAISAGVPMFNGGDEFLRTQYCNNNPYNLDSNRNWIEWDRAETNAPFLSFTRQLLAFRHAHHAFRPIDGYPVTDRNGDGMPALAVYTPQGRRAEDAYLDNPANGFLGLRYDGTEYGDTAKAFYVAYNSGSSRLTITLPPAGRNGAWLLVSDTSAWMETENNFSARGSERVLDGATYDMSPRSVLILMQP